jgi:hypothetical protein
MNQPTVLFGLLAGVVLLIAGRRLFWLLVAIVGAVTGMRLALLGLGHHGSQGIALFAALIGGLIGLALAAFLQKVAIAGVGFFVGGYAAVQLFPSNGAGGGQIVFLIGGILAAILAVWLFEGALIVLSSMAGASLIADALHLEPAYLFVLGLAVVGIAVQAGFTARARRRTG